MLPKRCAQFVLPSFLLFMASALYAQAQDPCRTEFLRSAFDRAITEQEAAAYFELLDKDSYSRLSDHTKAGLTSALKSLPFALSFNKDHFEEERETVRRETSTSYDRRRAESVVQGYMTPEALAAWTTCQRLHVSSGLRIVQVQITPSLALLELYYSVPNGAPARISSITITGGRQAADVNGRQLLQIGQRLPSGSKTGFAVTRNPGDDLSVTITASGSTDVFYAPHVPSIVAQSGSRRTLADLIGRGNNFIIFFDSLKNQIGTIGQRRVLLGTFTRGSCGWHLEGPNTDRAWNEQTYYPQNSPNGRCYKPEDSFLNVWGAIFTFDESGRVSSQAPVAVVGHLWAQDY